jgi:putative ABC transport system substrate-binding protein
VTNLNTELGPKRLELLRQLIPTASTIALLANPTSPFITETMSREMQSAARALGLQLHIVRASTEHDFATVLETLAQLRASALVIAPDALFISKSEQLGALTVRPAMPAITSLGATTPRDKRNVCLCST